MLIIIIFFSHRFDRQIARVEFDPKQAWPSRDWNEARRSRSWSELSWQHTAIWATTGL